jgi:antibiotic biosynthesis monooxygenase (ABM) superfamily enzyme
MSQPTVGERPMSATVVIVQNVRPEHEGEYLRWQAEINGVCGTFPGFEAAEIVPSVPGVQDDCVVVFRFDSAEHLAAWLRSDARQTLLARGQSLFGGAARQHVVAGARPGVGMVVSTRVKAGREHEYREWQNTIDREAARFPGFLGNEVFPPVPGLQDEWVVVVRFDSAASLRQWLESDVRRRLNDEATRLWHEARVESFSGGFPGWFTAGVPGPGQPALPPNWKQAMVVLLVLFPTVMLLSKVLSPLLTGLPFPLQMFLSNVASVVLMTWLFMPLTLRGIGFWLTPAGTGVGVRGLVTVLAGYALAITVFLALG